MNKYLWVKVIAKDVLALVVVYVIYLIITKPELVANWIRVIRGAFL